MHCVYRVVSGRCVQMGAGGGVGGWRAVRGGHADAAAPRAARARAAARHRHAAAARHQATVRTHPIHLICRLTHLPCVKHFGIFR